MNKKNFEIKAFDSKGKEIKLQWANVFYGIRLDKARDIRIM